MLLPMLLVFIGTFTVAALVLVASYKPAAAVAEPPRPKLRMVGNNPSHEDVRKVVLFSAIPWMNRMLQKMELAPRLRLLIYQADLRWTVGGLLLFSAALGTLAAYITSLRFNSFSLALLAGILLAFVPIGVVLFKRGKRFAKFEEELPKALDLMVSGLRAGHSFNATLGLVARECADPIRNEFKLCFDEQNYGLELVDAMENLMVRIPLPDLRITVTAVLIQKETGGNLAEVLNNTASVIRERTRLKRQIRVHTAHGRLTGWIIGMLPVALLVVLYFLNPELESLLWTREIGRKMLCGGAGMMIVGGLIIRKIVQLDV